MNYAYLHPRDEIALTLSHEAEIAGFEARSRAERDWL